MNLKSVVTMAAVIAVSSISITLRGQSADTPIADQSPAGIKKADAAIIETAKKLIEKKKLLSYHEVKKQLLQPKPQPFELKAVQTKPMALEDISSTARKANFRVGYCYLCKRCDNWHLNLAGGYPIAKDVVATCDHVVDTKAEIREGYLIVVDQDGNLYPVTSVLARSVAMDAALIQCEGAEFTPLALNAGARQGAAAFCYSTPMSQQDYFSDGIINRFFWNQKYQGGEKDHLETARHLRVNFSTDWAPGSSGSAVLDQCGNVLGHVSQISALSKDRNTSAFVTLHTGIPAHGVLMLAQACQNPEDIAQLCALEAKENAPKEKDEAAKSAIESKPAKKTN
jgi:hypothetical protein